MNHLTEEDLVIHVYGEGGDGAGAHLEDCAACARAYAEVQREVAELRCPEPPEPRESYEAHVWQAIRGSLSPYPRRRPIFAGWLTRWFAAPAARPLAYAALCALLVAGAFYAGRHWEAWRSPRITARKDAAPPAPQPKQPIVVVVLGDHLDRSERLLVELKHADIESAATIAPLSDEARTLLAANRVCRKTAEQEGDPALESALDHLDHLLSEMANQPGGLNAGSIARLKHEMESDGLLFEVRVLRSRVRNGRMETRGNGGSA